MIGMAFGSFLTLLVVGFIAALILHYGFQYRMLPGFDGFLGKWAVGWVAAWLSSPVLGHWGFQVSGEYVIPAMVGATASSP